MQFKNKVVVITGGAHGIGRTTREAFESEGAIVEVINNAIPIMRGIDECSCEEFEYALAVE